jgi:hypothetical protein
MWGNVLIVGLAMVRVAQVASLPSWPRRDGDVTDE